MTTPMKKFLLLPLLVAVALSAGAQIPVNRYGFPLTKNGETQAAFIRQIYQVNPDTVPGWNEPYQYIPTDPARDFGQCDVQSYVYKKHDGYECRMDVYLPKEQGDGPFPYIMFIHGGSWKNGTEKNMKDWASYFASHGVAGVSVSYTLMDKGDFTVTNRDLLDAKAFVDKHAKEWKIDPERFGFSGISAGGHLSSFMAMTVPDTRVLIAMCGPQDLTRKGPRPGSGPIDSIVTYFGTTDENLEKSSPLYRIPDNPPATMLIHGTFDLLVLPRQSYLFAEALRKKGDKEVELLIIPYAAHVAVSRRVAGFEENLDRMLAFAKKHLD